MKISKMLLFIIMMLNLTGCNEISAQSFSVAGWKSASKDERRRIARDFLNKYTTKGMSLSQLKELLGEPDYEIDVWTFNLSANGAPPSGPHQIKFFLDYPQLFVHFREGKVHEVSVTYQLDLPNDLRFEAPGWKTNEPIVRLRMAANLIASGVLKGLTKRESRELLGTPDRESERRLISYDLGLRMVDVVTLYFTLDNDGRVVDARIYEH